MRLLSEKEFLSTMDEPMKQLGLDAPPPFDFWPYFDAIPAVDFEGHDCSAGRVTYVWEHPASLFQHVLINSEDPNIFMVIILSLATRSVVGYRLLDLREAYGLEP
jgi:hypothetical protein